MTSRVDRRELLKIGSAFVAGAAWNRLAGSAMASEPARCASPTAAKLGWTVGLATYSLRQVSFYEALDQIVALGITAVEPAFFLRLDKARPELKTGESLSPELRKEWKTRMADRGISMPSFYSDLGADQAKARKICEFCKEMGAGVIVCEPPLAAMEMIDKLCEEYQLRVAIHNHPGPKKGYWDPESVLKSCEGRSSRVGACIDTGHWVRSNLDVLECLKKLERRIVSVHLKDAIEKKHDARDVPLGDGKAGYTEVLKELKRQGFRGLMMIEYEHMSPQLLDELAKSVAFMETTCRSLCQ